MCIRHFVTILAGCCLLTVLALGTSCTEAQRRGLDHWATGADQAGKTLKDLPNSPAGPMIPEPVKSGVMAGGIVLEALALAWLRGRGKVTDTALKAVTAGVDALPSDQANQAKESIGQKMTELAAAGKLTYETLNAVIDKAKAT